jgi:hypothetical protein
MIWTRLAFAMIAAAMAVGCAKPYHFNVNGINESPGQRRAVITISDPQIYSRETLVDDRRGETQYLKDLIKESPKVAFESQLRRDVRSITALSAQLGIAFDPGKGLEFSRAAESSGLEHQVRVTQLQTQLVELQNRLREVQTAGTAASSNGAAASGPTTLPAVKSPGLEQTRKIAEDLDKLVGGVMKHLEDNAKPARAAEVKSTPQEEFRDRQAYREELRAALAGVNLDDLHDLGGNALIRLQFRATVMPGEAKDKFGMARLTIKRPPLSEEDVRRLYITWLAHVNYRLNQGLTSGAVPEVHYEALGLATKLFGVVRLPLPIESTACRSARERGDAVGIASECKVGPPLAVPPQHVAHLQRLDVLRDAVAVLRAAAGVPTTPTSAPVTEALALTKRSPDPGGVCVASSMTIQQLYSSLGPDGSPTAALTTLRSNYAEQQASRAQLLQKYESRADGQRPKPMMPSAGGLADAVRRAGPLTIQEVLEAAETIIGAGPAAVAGMQGLPDHTAARKDVVEVSEARAAYDGFVDLGKDLRRLVDDIARRPGNKQDCPDFPKDRATEKYPVPDHFGRLLAEGDKTSAGLWSAGGDVYAYATAPVELSQRVSTVASAAHAAQLALALSAVVPGKGLGADAAFGYLQGAVGRVEALERAPIIVGFSDRGATSAGEPAAAISNFASAPKSATVTRAPSEGPRQFGWVFGPRVVVDPRKRELRLEHGLVNQQVSADVSVPGWWPRLEFDLETAWIGNWHDVDGSAIGPLSANGAMQRQPIRVSLPPNRADMDGLTTFLARRTTGHGLARAQIDRVVPTKVSACADKVTFLIHGRGIWRSTEVFLAGLRHEDLSVLPDMEGVAATFSLKHLPRRPSRFEQPLLTVWTRNGTDSTEIEITGGEKAGKVECGDEALLTAPPAAVPAAAPSVSNVRPDSLARCAKAAVFFLTGDNLTPHARVYLGATAATSVRETASASKQLVAEFTGGPFADSTSTSSVPFTVVTQAGISGTTAITLDGEPRVCPGAPGP